MKSSHVLRRPALTVVVMSLSILLVGLNPITTAPLSAGRLSGPQTPTQFWMSWTSLGKPSGGTVQWPVVGQNQDGRLEVFAQVYGLGAWPYLSVYHIWQTAPNGGWSNWASLGLSEARAAPAVGQNLDGRLEVFAQGLWIGFGGICPGQHYEVSHIHQTAPSNGWSSWSSLDQPIVGTCIDLADPHVGRNQDGRLDVFAKGADGNLWHRWQTAPSDGWVGSWASLGRPAGVDISPILSVGRNQDGRLEVFTLDTNYEIRHIWQNAVNDDNNWSGWGGFGKPSGVSLSNPAVSWNEDGRQEFFTSGSDGAIWHKWQVAPNSYWSGWGSLSKPSGVNLGDPIVGRREGGAMEVFAQGSDFAVWHILQTAPSDGWGAWSSLGKPSGVNLTSQLAVGRNQDGRMAIFAVGDDGALWTNSEVRCYSLTIDVNPSVGGIVHLEPAPGCPSLGMPLYNVKPAPGYLLETLLYLEGTNVTLTAVPHSGYVFSHWSGDASESANPTTLTMNGSKSVTAYFTWRLYLPMVLR